jgi:hypothetical protein
MMIHELWVEGESEQTFCLAGPHGAEARSLLMPSARLIWSVEASSHFEAMCRYYEYMGWGQYKTEFPELDKRTYKEMGWEQ